MLTMDLPAAITAERSRDLAREAQASRLAGAGRLLRRQGGRPTACCAGT